MDLLTPYRFLRSLDSTEGRTHYRREWRRRIWRFASQRGQEHTLDCLLKGRLRMRVSTADQCISRAIYVNGFFEQAELAFIRAAIRPGMNVIDVGANIGVHTLTLADCVGSGGLVHAFEPTAAFDRLRENVALNRFESRTQLRRCAVGSFDGLLPLLRCKAGYEAFTSRGIPLHEEYTAGGCLEVPVLSLDTYAEQNDLRSIDFVKIDVEGMETEVLQGAAGLFASRRIHQVMFEVNETCLVNCGSSAKELIHLARRLLCGELRVLDKSGHLCPCPDAPTGNWTTVVGWRS